MGCGSSGQVVASKPVRKQTVCGVLTISLLSAHLEHETTSFFSMDPYPRLKLGNQEFKGKVVPKGGKQPVMTDVATFFINSCYQVYGRSLEVQILDSNVGSDSNIGFGIIDIDPLIVSKQGELLQDSTKRCFLNFDCKPAGFVSFKANFKEEPTQLLWFRFETASITRKTRTFGDMNLRVKLTAGEEVFETTPSKDTPTQFPVWKDQLFSVKVPTSLTHAKIELIDELTVVGELKIDLAPCLADKKQISSEKELVFTNAVAAKIKMCTLASSSPDFSQLKNDYTKKAPAPPPKKEEDKPAPKKEEDKPAPKKEEGKPAVI